MNIFYFAKLEKQTLFLFVYFSFFLGNGRLLELDGIALTCLNLLFCRAYLDCHLMVTNPLDYVEPLAKAGASGFTFHVEVSKGTLCLDF